jgi:predicted GNAT family acetyltransferase
MAAAGNGVIDLSIVDNLAAQRFETVVDGLLCRLDYRRRDTALVMEHVFVPELLRGRGIAAALTETALQTARRQGLRVVPDCPYVVAWLRRHPGYADLVDEA